jgi:hypothetical protein
MNFIKQNRLHINQWHKAAESRRCRIDSKELFKDILRRRAELLVPADPNLAQHNAPEITVGVQSGLAKNFNKPVKLNRDFKKVL